MEDIDKALKCTAHTCCETLAHSLRELRAENERLTKERDLYADGWASTADAINQELRENGPADVGQYVRVEDTRNGVRYLVDLLRRRFIHQEQMLDDMRENVQKADAERDTWRHHAESRSLAMDALTKARDRAQSERDSLALLLAEKDEALQEISERNEDHSALDSAEIATRALAKSSPSVAYAAALREVAEAAKNYKQAIRDHTSDPCNCYFPDVRGGTPCRGECGPARARVLLAALSALSRAAV
jgi:hypothetical protein